MLRQNNNYIIGVDGGGAKTVAALANLNRKILASAKTGSSNSRNLGLKRAMDNVALVIKIVLARIKKGEKIASTFLGLPCLEEEYKFKKGKIKKELLKHREISPIFKGKVIIGSDQLVGFRSGTEKSYGLVLIAGSGCVVHGWSEKNEIKVDGWGYLTEQGSAFWIGQKGLQAVFNDLDGRGPRTLITNLVFQKFKIKNKIDLLEKIYLKNPIEVVPTLSVLVDEAGRKNDKVAKKILTQAARELALSAEIAIKKLNFSKREFPVVLIGSVFKSKSVSDTVKMEIKKIAPKADFIIPKKEAVVGAVKLALESLPR